MKKSQYYITLAVTALVVVVGLIISSNRKAVPPANKPAPITWTEDGRTYTLEFSTPIYREATK